jgi:CMP-N-acetylneuraminic acid synthetase
MKLIAMIPARLGSKRVLKKNLRLLNGRPLISYNIIENTHQIWMLMACDMIIGKAEYSA